MSKKADRNRTRREVGQRFRSIRNMLGVTQTRFAEALGGCSQAFIADIETGRSGPSALVITGLEGLGFSGRWLLTGEGEMFSLVDRAAERAPLYGQTEIPLLGSVAAGAGRRIPEDEVERMLPVFLGRHSACQCFATKVAGRSMEPVFKSGDIIVIDKSCPPQNNDVAVVVVDGQVMLKKVSMDDHHVYLLSLNRDVPPLQVSRKHDSARIVGKVVQLIREKF